MSAADPLVAVVDCGPGDRERLAPLAAALPTRLADGAPDADAIVARAAGATVLVTIYTYTVVGEEVLAQLPDLRLVITRTAGHSHVDAEAAARRGVAVAAVPEGPTAAVAEYTLAALLALRRDLLGAVASTRGGAWEFTAFRGGELAGQTLGVLGLGQIGGRIAQLAGALGMEVLGWSRSRRELPGVEQVGLEELLDRSHAISVNLPLTAATRGLLGARELELLPPGALVVDTSRGGIVALDALCRLLRDGRLGGACLDVLPDEPVDAARLRELARVPNLLVTPHVSWHTEETLRRQFDGLLRRVVAFCAGEPIDTVTPPLEQGANR